MLVFLENVAFVVLVAAICCCCCCCSNNYMLFEAFDFQFQCSVWWRFSFLICVLLNSHSIIHNLSSCSITIIINSCKFLNVSVFFLFYFLFSFLLLLKFHRWKKDNNISIPFGYFSLFFLLLFVLSCNSLLQQNFAGIFFYYIYYTNTSAQSNLLNFFRLK